MDHGYALLQCVRRTFCNKGFPIHKDFSAVQSINPRKYFHDGGFPRAIFPHQRMYFPALYIQGNIVERHNARKFLSAVLHLQNKSVLTVHVFPPFIQVLLKPPVMALS